MLETWTLTTRRHAALIFAAAILMGLPTLRGGFVGGDDHRLALDHVFVNRPSFEHAVALFQIVHRDLYQPLPLLSFQLEFVIADLFGLKSKGPEAFGWFFHLNNILLHAINSLLVFFLIRALHTSCRACSANLSFPASNQRNGSLHGSANSVLSRTSDFVPATAGLFFAIHPFQTETVAWLNGRMMLLSTLFLLLGILAQIRWMDLAASAAVSWRKLVALGIATVFLFLSCNISKIRVEIPVLMLLVAGSRRVSFNLRFVTLWLPCAAVTAFFAWLNIHATAAADLFAGGEEHLKGPNLARVALALSFYFEHLLWPTGLASYYPTPPVVSWFDPETIRALWIIGIAVSLLIYGALVFRSARFGAIWFFAAIAATLPFVPARNVLAADRYMYVPIIGLLWPAAETLSTAYCLFLARAPGRPIARIATMLAAAIAVTLIGICWHTAWFYEDPVKKTYRVAMLFPDVPRVWERLGWTYHEIGEYEKAAESAKKEIHHDNAAVQAGAYQLLGMTALRQGNSDEALRLLQHAVEVDPKDALGRFRLGMAYDELNQPADALPHLEAAAQEAPTNNPTLHRLAAVYRRLDRSADARRCYENERNNNPYEWPATIGLVELDLETATAESRQAAERRLRDLLAWMPENVAARINLGVVLHAQGRVKDAILAYQDVLAVDPKNPTAALNLAQVFAAQDDPRTAAKYFLRAADAGPTSLHEAAALVDFFASHDQMARAVAVADALASRVPLPSDAVALVAWTRLLNADPVPARKLCGEAEQPSVRNKQSSPDQSRDHEEAVPTGSPGTQTSRKNDDTMAPFSRMTCAYLAFLERRFSDAAVNVQRINAPGASFADARRRLLAALERFDRENAGEPWTFCLAADLLLANQQLDAARASADLCAQNCKDAACATHVEQLKLRFLPSE